MNSDLHHLNAAGSEIIGLLPHCAQARTMAGRFRWTRKMLGIAICLAVFSLSLPNDHGSCVADEGATGGVAGTVHYRSDAKRPWRYSRYYVKWPSKGNLAEAVVALKGASLSKRGGPLRTDPVVINQRDYRFSPETVAVRVGERVKFTNTDVTVHNVMTYDGQRPFNVNTPMGGEYTHEFTTAGGTRQPVRIGCSYHSQMRAWIYVFAHPFFVVTEADGKFSLEGIPAGEYELEVVHPAGNLRSSQPVVIKAGETASLRIELSPDQLVETKP